MGFAECEPAFDLVFAPKHHGIVLALAAQHVFGKIQTGVGEPGGAGHFVAVNENTFAPGLSLDIGEGDDALPELFPLLDGKRKERIGIGDIDLPAVRHRRHEGGHVGAADFVLRRLPQRLGYGFCHYRSMESPP